MKSQCGKDKHTTSNNNMTVYREQSCETSQVNKQMSGNDVDKQFTRTGFSS